MRIYQFSQLLAQLLPDLSEHLTAMGVEPAYLSQWFLSCFAVTCPLPMLFRIYDVIFAEGANETVMRVALALMRRNEQTMLEATEFEEVMQLLLGRALWDPYVCNADELVDDFTSLGNEITHARLAELEKEFESRSGEAVGEKAGFLPEVQAAASRFLGRLWAPTHTPSKSMSTLSPPSGERDFRSAFLRRSPSKHSIGTINDGNEGSSSGSGSMASTAATETDVDVIRDSTTDDFTSKSGSIRTMSVNLSSSQNAGMSKEDRDLHTQIEDLLTALSGMQREHADLTAMLQREREERGEDHRLMKRLMARFEPENSQETGSETEDRRRTLPPPVRNGAAAAATMKARPTSLPPQSRDDLSGLLGQVRDRLTTNARLSSTFETKAQIKSTLTRTREQLDREEKRSRELTLRMEDAEAIVLTYSAESDDLRVEVEELRRRVNDDFKERQKLEQTVRDLQTREHAKARRSVLVRAESMNELPTSSRIESASTAGARKSSVSSAPAASNGLREFRLRNDSNASTQMAQSRRSVRMSLSTRDSLPRILTSPSSAPQTPAVQPQVLSPDITSPQVLGHQRGLTVSSIGVGPAFGGRTSSLATQKVLATPEHEPAAEEALLLELVNAKTSEAQARQEVDELRRSLAVQRRKQEDALRLAQAETESFRAQAAALQAEADARRAKDTAIAAEAERKRLEAERSRAALAGDGGASTFSDAHVEDPHSAPAASSGWFWSKRSLSTTTASILPKMS